jgi:hypothetical protein
MRYALGLIVICLLSATTIEAKADQPAMPAASVPGSIVAILATNQTSYAAGQDVRVRITTKNAATVPVAVQFVAPWYDSTIQIVGPEGIVQPSIKPDHPAFAGSV